MRGIEIPYEVRIYMPSTYNGDRQTLDKNQNKLSFKNIAKTFGVRALSLKQAEIKAEKLAEKHGGWVASVRKSETETIFDIKNIRLLEPLSSPVTHSTVMKMEDFVWQKRTRRIENQNKDKKDLDNN